MDHSARSLKTHFSRNVVIIVCVGQYMAYLGTTMLGNVGLDDGYGRNQVSQPRL